MTDVLIESHGTFQFKVPVLADFDSLLVTSDPADIHYLLRNNFNKYPTGHKLLKIFDILGGGIFYADGYV